MLLTAAVTTRPFARRVAVIAPAASISDMIQPPNISPLGLVSAGIARVRAASSPRGCGGLRRRASRSVQGDIAQLRSQPTVPGRYGQSSLRRNKINFIYLYKIGIFMMRRTNLGQVL